MVLRLSDAKAIYIYVDEPETPPTPPTPVEQRLYDQLTWELNDFKQLLGSEYYCFQLSEFRFIDQSGNVMAWPAGTTITSNYTGNPGEGVENIIDGDVSTKYCPWTNDDAPVASIVIDLGTPMDFGVYNRYQYFTANDSPNRDPIGWTLYGRLGDGTRETISEVVDADVTDNRESLAGTWTLNSTEETGRQPNANTLLYLPLDSTNLANDLSGNNVTTSSDGVNFTTYQGVDCGCFNGSSNHIQITPFAIPNSITVAVWCYCTGYDVGDGKIFDARLSGNPCFVTGYSDSNNEGFWMNIGSSNLPSGQLITNNRVLLVYTCTNGEQTIYVKGNGVNYSYTFSESFSGFTPTYMNVGNEWDNGAPRHYQGGMSKLIVEDKIWTQQEADDYYDQTKLTYGIQ